TRSVEEIALDYRERLEESLTTTRKLSRNDDSLSTLINRMNAVLGTAVVTNFGTDTNHQLSILYETIDRLQPDISENLALLYFARSFAVVLEEAVRQKEEGKRAAENEIEKEEKEEVKPLSSPWCGCDPASCEPCPLPSLAIGRFDSSIEATRGVLSIYGVAQGVQKSQLSFLLNNIGPLRELHLYTEHDSLKKSLVVCRYENHQVAYVARARLHGRIHWGSPLFVYFASFRIRLTPSKREAANAPGAASNAVAKLLDTNIPWDGDVD
ncbi:hypothetical protein PFISCL1PPCAC_21264, partial [Pristionchus fissidentatus]